jgi:hypothetical protein
MNKNSLAENPPDQVERMVETMLAPEQTEPARNLNSVASAHTKLRPAPPAADPTPAPPAPSQPTQNIAMGQTIGQVVAIMGKPKQIVDLGIKKTYTYPDLKIVFVNGKVTDVQ